MQEVTRDTSSLQPPAAPVARAHAPGTRRARGEVSDDDEGDDDDDANRVGVGAAA